MMMEVQQGQIQSFYGSGNKNIRDHVNVRSINDNQMWVGRSVMSRTSPSHDCSSTWIDRDGRRSMKMVSSSKSPPKNTSSWWNEHEVKRRRRVAKYKVYSTESKLKCSLKNGFRSLKIKCMNIVYNL